MVDKDKIQVTEQRLIELYCIQKKTISEIANICGLSRSTIHTCLKRYGIKRRQPGENVNKPQLSKRLSEEILIDLYYHQHKSLNQIAEIYDVGISSIRHLMDKYDLKRREAVRESRLDNIINEETLRELYCNQRKSTRKVAEILNISQATVRKYMKKFSIKPRENKESRKRPLQQRLPKEMLSYFYIDKRMSTGEIAEITNEREQSIVKLLHIYKIPTRTYSESTTLRHSGNKKINVDFFKKESNEFFYILGLLLTDGYVTDSSVIGLGMTDKDVIEWVARTIGYKNEIHKEKHDLCIVMGREVYNPKPRYKIQFQNEEVAKILKGYCLVARKSYELECPIVPQIYVPDFLRGVLDGDGWIMTKLFERTDGETVIRGRLGIGSASKSFIKGIKELIESLIGGDRKIYHYDVENMFRYIISSKAELKCLLEKLYYDGAFGMFRKLERILDIVNEASVSEYTRKTIKRDKLGRFSKL